MNNATTARETRYCTSIKEVMQSLGHATNSEILKVLRIKYPKLSATTVHRATSRLADRGELSIAPTTANGSMRYDFNTKPHDHFMCSGCSMLQDVDIVEGVKDLVEGALSGCRISGRVTVSGLCKKCKLLKDEL